MSFSSKEIQKEAQGNEHLLGRGNEMDQKRQEWVGQSEQNRERELRGGINGEGNMMAYMRLSTQLDFGY